MKVNEKILFESLVKDYGFHIEEYFCSALNHNRWIALKKVEGGIFAVICSDGAEETFSAQAADEYLRQKNVKFKLVNVIGVKNSYQIPEFKVSYLRVIFDIEKNAVASYEEGAEVLAKVISSLTNKEERRKTGRNKSKITNILISVNVLVFLLSAFMSRSIFNINSTVLMFLGAKVNYLIDQGQIYRLITAMFLHGGLIHIGFNMYALYSLGNFIEEIYGKRNYIIIYFAGGLISTFASYVVSPYMSVGASGAIFALLGSALVFGFKEKNRIGRDFLTNIISIIVLNIVIGLSTPNIDNIGHMGGLIGGILISFMLYKLKPQA